MIVYGDYINTDTRIILASLTIVNESHNYVNMNTSKGEHRDSTTLNYVKINPSGQIPTLILGKDKIIGGITS